MSELVVEVVFALKTRQVSRKISIDANASVADAMAASGIEVCFPEFDFSAAVVGIWGRVVSRDHGLRDLDRVEIYRPLEMDPREARRLLAQSGKTMSGQSTTR